VAKLLPQAWQKFATGMAKVCHRHGKSLPRAGQKFATGRKNFWPRQDIRKKDTNFAIGLAAESQSVHDITQQNPF
jgi:hypothetical protein